MLNTYGSGISSSSSNSSGDSGRALTLSDLAQRLNLDNETIQRANDLLELARRSSSTASSTTVN